MNWGAIRQNRARGHVAMSVVPYMPAGGLPAAARERKPWSYHFQDESGEMRGFVAFGGKQGMEAAVDTHLGPVRGWTLVMAEALLQKHQDLLKELGLQLRIVGSVVKLGQSVNDLDLLVRPLQGMNMQEMIDRISSRLLPAMSATSEINILSSASHEDHWFFMAVDQDGRVIEFYFSEKHFPIQP